MLKGKVDIASGGGPAVVYLKNVPGGIVPETDTVITHLPDGTFDPPVSVGFVGNDFVFRNEDDELHTTHLYMHLAYQEKISGRPDRKSVV